MIEILMSAVLICGSFFILLAALGIVKFPDLYTRMHAAAKAASFGSGLMLIAAVLYFRSWYVTIEAMLIILFIFLTAPVASHMISRAAYLLNIPLWEKTVIDEIQDCYQEECHSHPGPEDKPENM